MLTSLLTWFPVAFRTLAKMCGMPIILSQGGVPIGIAPTGTMAANGAVTLGTALGATYSGGMWLYFPAGAVAAASAAGFYWTVMTNTTAGTVYTNTYTPGTNSFNIPASPTAVADAGPGAYTGVTSETTAVSVTVPGGLMGKSGGVMGEGTVTSNNTGGNKVWTFKFGATLVKSVVQTTATIINTAFTVRNRGATNVQTSSLNLGNAAGFGSTTGPAVAGTVDTTADVVCVMTIDTAVGTDWIVLDQFQLLCTPS